MSRNVSQLRAMVRAQQHAPMSLAQLAGLTNAYIPPEVLRLRRAQKIAAEVRARHPGMQVRKVALC